MNLLKQRLRKGGRRGGVALSIGWSAWPAEGQRRRNGMILKDEACMMPPLTYAQDMEWGKRFYEVESDIARKRCLDPLPYQRLAHATEAEWNAMRAHAGFESRQIRYLSDGLEINGFIYKPVNTVRQVAADHHHEPWWQPDGRRARWS